MGRCIHCLRIADVTRDHVFPKSWYPESTPADIQRPTAPSCSKCNGELGELEGRLLQRLGLCLDPSEQASAGISQKALRAVGVGPTTQLSPKEKRIRAILKKQLLMETTPLQELEAASVVLPGFGPYQGFPEDKQLAVHVPTTDLRAVCGKIVRGLEYHLEDRYIESPWEVKVYFLDESNVQQFAHLFQTSAVYLGPGFDVRRVAEPEGSGWVLYKLGIWGKWTIHGSVGSPGNDPAVTAM